jgi:hypothetical protein
MRADVPTAQCGISPDRLGGRVAHLNPSRMSQMCAALAFSLGCDLNQSKPQRQFIEVKIFDVHVRAARGTHAPFPASRHRVRLFSSSTWGRADQQTSHDSNRVWDVLFCAQIGREIGLRRISIHRTMRRQFRRPHKLTTAALRHSCPQ